MQTAFDVTQHSLRGRFLKLRYFVGLMVIAGTVAFLIKWKPAESAANEPMTVTASGLTVTVEPASGNYSVDDRVTGWQFTGSLHRRVSPPLQKNSRDRIGNYTSITFDWDDKGPVSGEIRAYTETPAVQFLLTCKSARPAAPAAFPALATPAQLHPFGYSDSVFSPRSFKGGQGPSPWLLFDDSAHAVIISPANDFMTTEIERDASNNLASGLNTDLANLPDGFVHETLLVVGESIHQAWDRWGHDLTDLAGKTRPANDQEVELRQFGYWTDNGANYYYKFDNAKGYDRTLLDVAAAYRKLNVPLGYMQLDSWWYYKSTTGTNGVKGDVIKNLKLPESSWNCYGGLMEYTAHPEVFRQGLPAFQQELGMPLITHNRWIDIHSPYRKRYKISGVAAVDPKWWDDITDYLKSAGVVVYEQDWLNEIYANSPEFASTTSAGEAFMDNMARATKQRGMRMQYCMATPHYYLQGSKYDNLTSVRVSNDRFEHGKWDATLYTSHLAASLGEWPWVDTFNSSEFSNMVLATLTAGPVGVGDAMEKIDAKNITMCCRPDGVIVKPDTSIVPLDQTYLSDAVDKKAPMIAAAYTDHGLHRTAYVFCFPRSAEQKQISFRPVDLGITTDAWVYEPALAKGARVAENETFTAGFTESNYKKAWSYFVVAPVGSSGISLIGDVGKIASAGRQRISKLEEAADHLTATIVFAQSETSVTLHGFAPSKPAIVAERGTVQQITFDESTHEFSVAIGPAAEGGNAVVRSEELVH